MITKEQLITIVPSAKVSKANLDVIVETLNHEFGNIKPSMAGFIAQCAHESGGFTRFVENLNYSSERLLVVFPKYFKTPAIAAEYGRKPEKIASRVYASRMGNGPEESGDGWKFRGRGFIQVTGKSNYTECGLSIEKDLLETPEYLESTEGAILSAIWYWKYRDLDKYARKDDIVGMTKAVNGGTHGLQERTAYYEKAKSVLIS